MSSQKHCVYSLIDLPLTHLHYLTLGKGEPLIMVPATISSIDNWINLIEFMAQKFRVHFFELPGHGKSTPFSSGYTSQLVATTLEHFIDKLGYTSINIMGFSFGGILTMTTLQTIPQRINRVILFAPCVSHHALEFSNERLAFLKTFEAACEQKSVRSLLLSLIHNKTYVPFIVHCLRFLGHIEKAKADTFEQKLLSLPESTLEVLITQIHEILTVNFPFKKNEFTNKCYFGMSTRDPLLDYDTTYNYISSWFPHLKIKSFDLPYHQPPEPLTVEQLNASYGDLLDEIKS